jgi:hypothetical protein
VLRARRARYLRLLPVAIRLIHGPWISDYHSGEPARRWRSQGPPGRGSGSGCVSVRGSRDGAWIVGSDETPVPYNPTVDDAFMPDAAQISAEVRERLGASVIHSDGVLPAAASTP